MEKKASKEIVLTSQVMEDSGIKMSLNQNDLIDIIVSDQVEKVIQRVNSLTAQGDAILGKYRSHIDAQKEKFLKELVAAGLVSPDVSIDRVSAGSKTNVGTWSISYPSIGENNNSRVEGMMYVGCSTKGSIPGSPCTMVLLLTENKEEEVPTGVKGVSMTQKTNLIYRKEFNLTDKILTPIIQRIKEHDEEVSQFRSLFPNGAFNPNKIAKESRIKLNKKILKNQAPGIAEELSKTFGMEI
jgi:hypothetical protein